MNVTTNQIQRGLVRYIENDVVKSISDKPVMMVAAVLGVLLKNSDGAVEKVMANPIVSALLPQTAEGGYDLDGLFQAIYDTIQQYGNFSLKLPLLSSPFVFSADDFRKLKSYMEEG